MSSKQHCFPTDNPYSSDRDTSTGSYWSHQQTSQQPSFQQSAYQQQQYQWNGASNEFCQSSKFSWQQQRQSSGMMNQQQQQHCSMGYAQQPQPVQYQQQQYGYQRNPNNLVATVTVQQSSTGSQSSRTPSRCDSVSRSESNCSSMSSNGRWSWRR